MLMIINKCLSSVITDEGSKPEILPRVTQTTAVFTRLKPVWNGWSISLGCNVRLMRSLVTFIFLYACESWTLTADLQIRIQAMEAGCENRAGKWTTRRPLDHHKETQTAVVWTCLPFIRSCQNHFARHIERGKRQGRQRKR